MPLMGHGDVLRLQAILPNEVGLDVIGHCHGAVPPVGEVTQHALGIKDPVGGGDKGEAHRALQAPAQKGGDAGVGVDHVGVFLGDDLFEHRPGAEHIGYAAPVHGDGVVADARLGDLGHIHAPVGGDGDIVPLCFQLFCQLHNVGLRPANVKAHGGHENFHAEAPLHAILTGQLNAGNGSDKIGVFGIEIPGGVDAQIIDAVDRVVAVRLNESLSLQGEQDIVIPFAGHHGHGAVRQLRLLGAGVTWMSRISPREPPVLRSLSYIWSPTFRASTTYWGWFCSCISYTMVVVVTLDPVWGWWVL